MSLYASTQDLSLLGLPAAATAGVAASRVSMLQMASLEADSYLRARYTLPLVAQLGVVEHYPAPGSTGTGQVEAVAGVGVVLTRAWGVQLEVLSTGALGVATARVSADGGMTWQAPFTITGETREVVLSATEALALSFSDPGGGGWFDGDVYYIPVRFGALTTHVVAIASWRLLTRRGVDPDGAGYDAVRTAYRDALAWLRDVRDNRIDPGIVDTTPGVSEGSFLFTPDDLTTTQEVDRRWMSVLGRQGRTSRRDMEDGV